MIKVINVLLKVWLAVQEE